MSGKQRNRKQARKEPTRKKRAETSTDNGPKRRIPKWVWIGGIIPVLAAAILAIPELLTALRGETNRDLQAANVAPLQPPKVPPAQPPKQEAAPQIRAILDGTELPAGGFGSPPRLRIRIDPLGDVRLQDVRILFGWARESVEKWEAMTIARSGRITESSPSALEIELDTRDLISEFGAPNPYGAYAGVISLDGRHQETPEAMFAFSRVYAPDLANLDSIAPRGKRGYEGFTVHQGSLCIRNDAERDAEKMKTAEFTTHFGFRTDFEIEGCFRYEPVATDDPHEFEIGFDYPSGDRIVECLAVKMPTGSLQTVAVKERDEPPVTGSVATRWRLFAEGSNYFRISIASIADSPGFSECALYIGNTWILDARDLAVLTVVNHSMFRKMPMVIHVRVRGSGAVWLEDICIVERTLTAWGTWRRDRDLR